MYSFIFLCEFFSIFAKFCDGLFREFFILHVQFLACDVF